jgi:membrane associated rhomboid family serine protease
MSDEPKKWPLSRPAVVAALVFGLPAGLAIAFLDMPAKLWAAAIIGILGGLVASFALKRWPS